MRNKFNRRIKKLLSFLARRSHTPRHQSCVDVREEYANAFRTESYIEFWTRVCAYSSGQSSSSYLSRESTTAARLPSYRLFAEHLLDPDQHTAIRILASTHLKSIFHSLLSDYFTQTANASLLCSLLLKDIDRVRVKYRSLQTILQSFTSNQTSSSSNVSMVVAHLIEFSNTLNPFVSSAPSPCRVRAVQSQCSELLKRLESSRDKVRAKLQLIAKLKCGSAFFLVTVTASLIVIVVAHGLVLLVAMPGAIVASMDMVLEKKLARVTAQLDAAAKGTYIFNKDLETISRLVARLNDELEHMRATVKFWLERKDDGLQADGEVARLLKKNECSFNDQLDELEEHLYLCFMTINRARELVLKEMVDSGQST
ncbi:hypothetical protein L6164_006022 [Bauhinia variegata]|uniref:Uncharacterized protein n=1 Tax=Bauhinia variegata TaxID=167791 RepID=A0ACB9PSG4_BAUVA|nr:hypothetical protein L6164_006022 [Bauhinia variegata]